MVHCLLIKDTGATFCWIPSHCGLTFNEWVDRAAKRGTISNMQPTMLDVPLSSKEMCNIIENDRWKRLGFSRSVSHYPVLNNATRSVSSLVYRLNFPNILCTFVRKSYQYIIFYSAVSLWSPVCLQNGCLMEMFNYFTKSFVKKKWLVLSLAYHLINLSFTLNFVC